MRLLVCLCLVLLAAPALAGDKPLYRYTDPDGRNHFTDRPPYKGAKPMVLYNQNAPVVSRKWADAAAAETIRTAVRFAVHFNTPTPGQVYQDAASGVPVAINVMPGLARGLSLRLLVDDRATSTAPLTDIHTVMHGLGAGAHALRALLIGADGRELARSAPVAIEIKPSLARN